MAETPYFRQREKYGKLNTHSSSHIIRGLEALVNTLLTMIVANLL
jgi:hypothetical protein